MPGRFLKHRARHGAGRGLAAIACLTAAAVAVNRAVRHGPAVRRGAEDVLAAVTIGAAVVAAVALLGVITWAALRLGRQARQRQDEVPGLPEPGLTVPEPGVTVPEPAVTVLEPGPAVLPVPARLPGRPLFITAPGTDVTAAEKPADQEAARW